MNTVKDIMSADCVTATTQDNIYELAVLMKNHDIGFVPIVDGGKLKGVVTDRDLVLRGYADKHSGSTETAKVMSPDPITIGPEASVDEAAKLMEQQQIRRLPVVEHGKLLGIVALGDLAVRNRYANEAGEALSGISEQDRSGEAAFH